MLEKPIVDGFTHSTSVLMLPTTYRALVLGQLEVLRRSTNYQFKIHSAPDEQHQTIPGFSQNEYMIKVVPGTLIWGLLAYSPNSIQSCYIQVTDMSTGMAISSDYELAYLLSQDLAPTPARAYARTPLLLAQPMLVSGSGQLAVEIYNSLAEPISIQLCLFCAEPMPVPNPCADPSQPCSV